MARILTVVGARPQFIKAAALSRKMRLYHNEILVHTGQHYDSNMSDVFFQELDIPKADYNLGISGGSHAQMTGRMLMALEHVFDTEKPDLLLLFGDTNSTLAAALCAVKLHIPVAHVESGNRFRSLQSPEEVNRILTDHVSKLRFACVESAMRELEKENLSGGSYLVGDPMYDAFLYYQAKAHMIPLDSLINLAQKPNLSAQGYYYLTCHRQENTDDLCKLSEILFAMESLDAPVVYPVHPRNKSDVLELQKRHNFKNIVFTPPLGYLASIRLVTDAKKVVTDSGGLQREAFFAGVQCVTVLDFIAWPETMVGNRNQLARPLKADILRKLSHKQEVDPDYLPFGTGHACDQIVSILNEQLTKGI